MNRREFFRRTLPAVAVTVAASSGGWSFDFFKRLLRRVLRAIEREAREQQIIRQIKYQARIAIRALADRMAEYFYSDPVLVPALT